MGIKIYTTNQNINKKITNRMASNSADGKGCYHLEIIETGFYLPGFKG
jgi:hypothetical protein